MSFSASSAKGKDFRTLPSVPQAVDVNSEDDKEVERILSKSQPSVPSRKRSPHEDLQEEGDTENKKLQETRPVEPVNIIGKLFLYLQ